jgi:hypothetical protein
MTLYSSRIVYPDGDTQEIQHRLHINQYVDLNGIPLAPPLQTDRMIVYRVYRISTDMPRGEEITNYHLELVRRDELAELMEEGIL